MASNQSIFEELTLKEQQALQTLYETDGYKVLKKAMDLLRVNAAKFALNATTWEEVKHLQGQAHGLKQLHLNLKKLHENQK